MATVIDSLIVRLGLDSKGLQSDAPAATRKLKDLEGQSASTERQVQKFGTTSKESGASIGEMTGALGKFLALLGGTLALKQFVMDTIESNAALDRFSKNIGLSVNTVSAWGNAAEEAGGSAKGLQGSMDMLSKAQTELRLTGQSSLIPYFSALGVSLATVGGQARPVDQILLDLSERFGHMDRTTANNMGRMMGIDQDTMNLLLRGRGEVELMIKRQKEYGAVSNAQAAEASKLQRSMVDLRQSFTALGRNLLQQASPALEKVLAMLTAVGEWARGNSEFLGDMLKVLAVGLAAVGVAALPIDAVVLAVAGLATGIVLLWQDYQTWKRGGDTLIDWERWKPGIESAAAGIEWLAKKAAAAFGIIRSGASVAQNAINGNWAGVKNSTNDMSNGMRTLLGLKPVNHGPAATNTPETATAAYMQRYFQDRGWSAAQAAGIAANLMTESGGRTNAVGDSGHAYGIAQWHPDRQANFAKFAGHDIRMSTLDEQLAFVQHELNQRGGRDLRGALTPAQAGAIVSREYEAPGVTRAAQDGEARRRGALAQTLAGVRGASATVAGASAATGAGSSSVTDARTTVTTGEIKVYTAATDANGIARDMSHAMDFLFTSQANTGLF